TLAQFKRIMDHSIDAVFAIDPSSSRIVECNRAACDSLGYERQELLQMGVIDFAARLPDNLTWPTFTETLQRKGAMVVAGRHRRKEGSEFPVEVTVRYLDDPAPMILAVARDVTEQTRIRQELVDSESRLKEAQRIAKLGHWEWNIIDNSLHWSEEVFRIFGHIEGDFPASYEAFMARVHPDDRAFVQHSVQEALNGAPYALDHRIVLDNDSVRTVQEQGVVTRNEQGEPVRMLGTVQDITTQKEREAMLEKVRRDAEEANRSKSRFLAHMSHEIRTPMNSVLGRAELLRESDLDAEQREHVEKLEQAGETLLDLINNVLDLSKAEADQMDTELRPFNLHQLMAGLHDLLEVQAAQKGLSLTIHHTVDVPEYLEGDRGRLRQILINLLSNSIKFTHEGGVELRATVVASTGESATLQFTVADTGIGISPEKRDHVFEAFAQADSSFTRRFGGTGLGLTLCKRFSDLMGGDLWLESEPGKGSTFYLVMPFRITTRPLPVEGTPLPTLPSLADDNTPAATIPLLLVDDSEDNRLLIQAFLRKAPYTIVTAVDGREAVERFRSQRDIDLILMDIQMPVMDGYEATRTIRAMEKEAGWNPIPIIALSAHTMATDHEQSYASGATLHLNKPVRRKELIDALVELTKKSA
ncbi:MAG: PAS domain-containing protein, partial [Magnetococcales bacterium]|nr:PAS domain-containing protein [Magnetococcales bacterium]